MRMRQAQALLETADSYSNDRSMDRTLWEARRIVDAAVHPDTGEILPHPFRMSGYVPFNGPICVAMVASTTTPTLLFWSWVNQSQNALVNYYNRNASSPMSNETLLVSYSAAVGSALIVAFGLATFIQKKYSPAQAQHLMKFVAFPSAVVASSLNCYIVRSPEIETGIPLMDQDGQTIMVTDEKTGATVPAVSQEAATRGVNSTAVSRAILQAPVYFVPPILLGLGPFATFLAKRPSARVPMTTFLLLTSFGLGLPSTRPFSRKLPPLKQTKSNQPIKICKTQRRKPLIRSTITTRDYKKTIDDTMMMISPFIDDCKPPPNTTQQTAIKPTSK